MNPALDGVAAQYISTGVTTNGVRGLVLRFKDGLGPLGDG